MYRSGVKRGETQLSEGQYCLVFTLDSDPERYVDVLFSPTEFMMLADRMILFAHEVEESK